jgi:hypothetical protein
MIVEVGRTDVAVFCLDGRVERALLAIGVELDDRPKARHTREQRLELAGGFGALRLVLDLEDLATDRDMDEADTFGGLHFAQRSRTRYDARMARVEVALLAALAGCGRIDFDPLDDAGHPCVWGPFSAPQPLVGMVESTSDDFGATPSADNLELVFFSFRPGGSGDADIYDAVRATPSDPWPSPSLVPAIESPFREASPTLTADRRTLVFATATSTTGPALIVESTRAAVGDAWSAGSPLPGITNTLTNPAPFISIDGLRLIYLKPIASVSTIVESTRPDRSSAFGAPVMVIAPAGGDDDAPALSSDGLDVFFQSATRGGSGGFDIFTAHRPALDQPFGPVSDVAELASAKDDVGARPSADGTTMYLEYNTHDGGGQNANFYISTRACM